MEKDHFNPVILAVDDNKHDLYVLGNILSSRNYEVALASTGADALKLVRSINPDVILLDIIMPGLDGYEICKQIKMEPKFADTAIIFLTAKTDPDDIVKGFQSGAVDYVSKPFRPVELLTRIDTHVKKRQAEKELRETQEFYKTILEDQTELICRSSIDGRLTYVNMAYCRYFEKSQEELIGRSFLPSMPDEDGVQLKKHLKSLDYSNKIGVFEHRVRTSNGDLRWLCWSNRALFDSDNNLTGFQSVGQDITDRKQKEQLFSSMTDQSPFPICIIEPDGTYFYLNNKFTELLGYTLDDIPNGREWFKKAYPDPNHRAEAVSSWLSEIKAFKVREVRPHQFPVTCKNGAIHHIIFRPVTLDDGRQFITLEDITERLNAEKIIIESEKKYRELTESLPQAVFETDVQGKLIYCNQVAFDIFGYTWDDLINGLNALDMIAPDERERALQNMHSRLRGEEIGSSEYNALRKDVTIFPVIIYSNPITQDGRIVGLNGIAIDNSDRKKREEELLTLQKLESIGLLAGGIAHDFNNILTGVLGRLSLLKKHPESTDKIIHELNEIESAALNANRIAQQFITFSKGGEPIKSISKLEEFVHEPIELALRNSNITVRYSIREDLLPVEIDKGQICQVIYNLIKNAIEAVPQDGVITITCQNRIQTDDKDSDGDELSSKRYVRMSVQDQGTGIPNEHLLKIFDPYFTTKKKHHGLGLACAHSIIRNHNGNITVDTELNKGSTFHVYLPAITRCITASKEVITDLKIARRRILVMDDEDYIRDLLSEMLQVLNCEVMLTNDGYEAIEQYKIAKWSGQPFDAVIMDLVVPGSIGGKESIDSLIELDPNINVIVSSGYCDDPIMANFREYGFVDVLPKPYKLEELSRVLNKVFLPAN
ncbi:MAG: PAS domain S-box protein [Deltaproteobacteria bacterium]|nr:PAS domain S-box protein [Deltaproteobacteria bacterium]